MWSSGFMAGSQNDPSAGLNRPTQTSLARLWWSGAARVSAGICFCERTCVHACVEALCHGPILDITRITVPFGQESSASFFCSSPMASHMQWGRKNISASMFLREERSTRYWFPSYCVRTCSCLFERPGLRFSKYLVFFKVGKKNHKDNLWQKKADRTNKIIQDVCKEERETTLRR